MKEDLWKIWDKQFLWAVDHLDPEVLRALLSYVLISLSRGRVPDPHLIDDFLANRKSVPACGYITCKMDEEHVH